MQLITHEKLDQKIVFVHSSVCKAEVVKHNLDPYKLFVRLADTSPGGTDYKAWMVGQAMGSC